jgi:hypothetical protein
MSEWIEASKPPAHKINDGEISEDVLVHVIGFGGYVRMISAFYSHAEEEWYKDDGDDFETAEKVTHWMELPESPL